MKWFQHSVDSYNDPDISDAEDLFGDAGYSVFFKVLEIYGREYNHTDNDGFLRISLTFIRRKLRKSSTKVQQILNFYQTKKRIFFKIDNKDILIKIPKYIRLSDNWTKRIDKKESIELCSDSVVTTAIEEEEEEEKKTTNEKYFLTTSVEYDLSERLLGYILDRNPNFKKPDLQNWAKEIDLIIRIDKRPTEQIRRVIDWCQSDDFWQNNILSVKKLRKQYDQLFLKMGKRKVDSFDPDDYLKGLENDSKRISRITT